VLDKKNGRKKFLLFVKDKVAEAYFCQGDRGERRSGHFSFSADLESGVQLTFPELGKTNSLRIQEVYPGSVCAINVFLYSDNLNLFFKWVLPWRRDETGAASNCPSFHYLQVVMTAMESVAWWLDGLLRENPVFCIGP